MKPRIRENLYAYQKVDYGHAHDSHVKTSTCSIIDCALGTNPFYRTNHVADILRDLSPLQVYPYQDSKVLNELKTEILKYLNVASVPIEQVFLGHGGLVLLERMAIKFIAPGKMLGISPQFCYMINDYVAAGGTYESISLLEEDFSVEKIERAVRTGQYNVVYVDNPNNPTGNYIPTSTLEPLMKICSENGTICIVDEAYGDFVDATESAAHYVPHYDNLIVLRSLSKGPGLSSIRSACLIMSQNIASVYSKIDNGFEPSYLSAILSIASLKQKDFIINSRKMVTEIKPYLMERFQMLGCRILPTHPEVSIFMAQKPGVDLYELFNSVNVLTTPGLGFAATTDKIDNSFIRFLVTPDKLVAEEVVRRVTPLLS